VKNRPLIASVLRIVLPYLVLGAAWILFSDRILLSLIDDPRKLLAISTAKGWLYVLITGALLFFLIYGEMRKMAVLESKLRDGLDDQGALLAELNHRVKNNLQIITSLLNLEAEDIVGKEARELNDRTRARIRSMGLAHERLFEGSEFARIDLGNYLRALWEVLTEIFEANGAHASFDLPEIRAGTAEAVPFGLFATEALSNAIRYGAGPDGTADVEISLKEGEDGLLELIIRDAGPGYPEGGAGLGFRLMEALTAQLRGSLERRNEGGAVVRLVFPSPGFSDA
jgi:two-component sensor histidine kinase